VIAQTGYEAATMSEIAERAGASIGSLYQFFPNKESVAEALRSEYCRALERAWEPLRRQAGQLMLEELVERLVETMARFYQKHPAFLKLLEAPASPGRSEARTRFRRQLAEMFAAREPRISRQHSDRLAAVTQQVMRALKTAYAEAPPRERRYVVEEFKQVLLGYFQARIPDAATAAKRS
jgi:AcrR family transcriptional regulator